MAVRIRGRLPLEPRPMREVCWQKSVNAPERLPQLDFIGHGGMIERGYTVITRYSLTFYVDGLTGTYWRAEATPSETTWYKGTIC